MMSIGVSQRTQCMGTGNTVLKVIARDLALMKQNNAVTGSGAVVTSIGAHQHCSGNCCRHMLCVACADN